MSNRPPSKNVQRSLDVLQRQLDGARKFLADYQGVDEATLQPWDIGMIRHYERVRTRCLAQIEELENGSASAHQ